MAELSVVSFPSPFTFNWTIPNISKLDAISSPEFTIEGKPLMFKVSKRMVSTSAAYIGVYICCNQNNIPAHAVTASIELLTFDSKARTYQRTLEPIIFTLSSPSFGFNNFLAWNTLFDVENKYVKDDTIKFNIKIEADSKAGDKKSTLNCVRLLGCCECTEKFRFTVGNIRNLMAVRSADFKVRDMTFYLVIRKNSSTHLGMKLHYSIENLSSCTAQLTVKLISLKNGAETIEQKKSKCFVQGRLSIKTKRLIPWSELIKSENGYGCDITLDVEVKVEIQAEVFPKAQKLEEVKIEAKVPKIECSICKKGIVGEDISCTPCGHLFCTPCITNAIKLHKICPIGSCSAKVPWNGLRRIDWSMGLCE